MPRANGPVSLADLASAGIQLRPSEAVAIVRELADQAVRGAIAGVPSAQVIRLSSTGSVLVEGPVVAGGRPVVRAAQLLESLLPDAESGPEFRVPGSLKLAVARGLGTLDLPPFGSLEAFSEALERFAPADSAAVIAGLAASSAAASAARSVTVDDTPAPASAQVQQFSATRIGDGRIEAAAGPLTISDIRRARRATGVRLAAVAERSRIPVGLLRQLEWGYFYNWPGGRYGRTQLVRYARAAGLDEQVVVTTVAPLLDQTEREAVPAPAVESTALVARSTDVVAVPSRGILLSAPPPPARRRGGVIAAAAMAALLALTLVPMWWHYGPAVLLRPVDTTQTAGTSGSGETKPVAAARPPAPQPADEPAPAPPSAAGGAVASNAPVPSAVPAAAADDAKRTSDAVPTAGEYQLATDVTAFSPSFASVGTAVFYHAEEPGGSRIERADTDGGNTVLRITRIVDDNANNYHVRPSPDGKRIAFDSDRDGVRGVYIADADGKHVQRVSGNGFAAVPSWSPDGDTLAFVRAEEGRPKVWNLWTLDLASNEPRRLTNYPYGQPWGGSWFPDGRRIAYSHENRLMIRDLDTGKERVFKTPVEGHLLRTPAVSPDGRRIVFQVHRDGTWLMDVASGAMRKILDDASAEEYTWAPDGKRLAYHSRRSGTWGVWVMTSR